MTIGIGGVSRSGKSQLAAQLADHFSGTCVVSMDDYCHPKSRLPKIKDRLDWERPGAYDFEKLINEISTLREKCSVVIAEGILIYYDPRLRKLFDAKLFLEISKSTFLERRKDETRWGHEPPWFLTHVWNSYEKYGVENGADTIRFSGEIPLDLNTVLHSLDSHIT